MNTEEIINWLLEGDSAIRYQTKRDLLGINDPLLQNEIEKQGWGKNLLDLQNQNAYWGQYFYQPKWISTHYTLLELKEMAIRRNIDNLQKIVNIIFNNHKSFDGGINASRANRKSDVCVCGMTMNYSCYFGVDEEKTKSVTDFILSQKMPDGGFNCNLNSIGAVHCSMHTTLSVLEGFEEYLSSGYTYRKNDILEAKSHAEEFLLMHSLYLSDKSGKIIRPDFLKFRYPARWFYNILRALDYFRQTNSKYDNRLESALNIISKKRTKEGLWKQCSPHTGLVHFEMEKAGKAGRWVTLKALRVLRHYGK